MLLKMERISWLKGPGGQASSRPESKRPALQRSPEFKHPGHTPRVQLFRYAFLNIVIQISMLFIATGFATMFCKNVEKSLPCYLFS